MRAKALKNPLPTGRPEKEIDWKRVDELLEAGAEGVEIAGDIGVHQNTFYDRVQKKYGVTFTEYCGPKYSVGNAKLKKAQFDKAIGLTKRGDASLLLHLGRTRLKQVDAQPEKIQETSPNDASLNFAAAYMKAEGEKMSLAKELEQLREEINALKSQANPVVQRSCEEIQHLGWGCQVGENVLEHSQTN